MFSDFIFNHIGYAVKDIDKTAEFYRNAGYSITETVLEESQHVYSAFLYKEGAPTIELVSPTSEDSPIMDILKRNGVMPYHMSYNVESIQDAINGLRKSKFLIINGPIEREKDIFAFLYNKNVGLIEIVQYK